ncbi:hypothetical protein ACFFMR_01430 [Micromonospora andamanensis]|uniref:hypothetical protein n=1 Tax=Micromonospora andamanensis TaxID=1287068 RepID=UPI001951C841|nr:hypothetical protein [Micromonospora andamanensis]
MQFAGVLVVDFLDFGAAAGEGLGRGGQRCLIGGGGVVRTLHLLDQLVEFGEVGVGGRVRVGGPGVGQALAVAA